MKVLHVVGSFYPAVGYGGPIASNRALCGALAALGIEVKVLTTNTDGARKLPKEFLGWRAFEGYEVFYGNRWLKGDLSPALALKLLRRIQEADIVHVGLTYNWFLPWAARLAAAHQVPLVLTPRGTLMPRARRQKGLKKRIYDTVLQRLALSRVAAFHATSEEEARALRELVPGARVAVIPNGVEVPEVLSERDPAAGPYGLYLGRLHPYKRVERIINAFARAGQGEGLEGRGERLEGKIDRHLEEDSTVIGPWSLIVAGDGEAGYRRELERVAREAGVAERVQFVGPVAGEKKARLLAGAEFVVQAPNPENFGNVVAEALAHGTPALVGKGLPWEGLDREGCGFWVDDSEEALAAGMRRLMALSPEERREMGARGRAWMAREFSWEGVGRRMIELYERLIEERKSVVDSRWKR